MKINYVLDKEKLEIIPMTNEEFSVEYGEMTTTPYGIGPKYFYDASDNKIYAWRQGGDRNVVYGGCTFTRSEAKEKLFKQALENTDEVEVYESLEEAKKQAENLLDLAIDEEWDDEIVERIRNLTL